MFVLESYSIHDAQYDLRVPCESVKSKSRVYCWTFE